MALLRIKFPNWPGWYISELTLTEKSQSSLASQGGQAITVSVASETHSDYSSDSPVFRGQAEGSERLSRDLALKFALREDLVADLVQEAAVYGALEGLQGSTIPRCFGLYCGSADTGQEIACLVLELWGECIQEPFKDLPITLRIRILQQLGEIHRCGLWHGDFAERNVLEQDGDVRIIDFDQMFEHQCRCSMNFRPGERHPDAAEFGCEQLWEICYGNMKIWQ